MIINRTPLRISLVGGGTDLPAFYQNHGAGAVVSFAINKYIYLSMHPYFERTRFMLKYSKSENVERVEDIEHRIIRQVFMDYYIEGVDFNSSADIPAGTGLGSSSAFTVGIAQLCSVFSGRYHSKEYLASYACEVEINKLGDPIGKQDQYASAYGGINYFRFESDESVTVEKICINSQQTALLESNLLLFYTGVARSAARVLKEQRDNTVAIPNRALALKKMVQLAEELKVDLNKGNIDAVGEAMHRGWMYKRELASGITNPILDEYYTKAMRAGALGGKLLGAGGGGFFLFYVPKDRRENVKHALGDLLEVPFTIDKNGATVIYYEEF